MDYTLNKEIISNIPFDKYEKNFTFLINGNEIKTNRLFADILSPIIRRSHYSDVSNDTFSMTIKTFNDETPTDENTILTTFNDFLNLVHFQNHSINKTQIQYYKRFFYELGNIDEYFNLQPEYKSEITTTNAITRLQDISEMKRNQNFETTKIDEIYNELVRFISTNFETISKEEMSQLNELEVESIISNKELKIYNEDSLFEFVERLYNEDRNKSFLFDYIIISNLSEETLERFFNEFYYEDLDKIIWKSISSLVLNKKTKTKPTEQEYEKRYTEPPKTSKTFSFDNNNKFNGILKYLSDESKGNILENKTIDITATSVHNDLPLRNLVDFKENSPYFRSEYDIQTITFDFKDKRIQMTDYSIQTGTDGTNGGHLKSWSIEVSDDNKKWIEIDYRENDQSLNGQNNSSTFKVQKQNNEFYRYVRLRQIGYPWSGSAHYIEIRFIEFYGQLK